MPTFGLIAEGPTDHAVLINILTGFFNDVDFRQYIRPLRPLRDATDASQRAGGWTRVLDYCRSSDFKEAFEQNDFLIIQIDTDCLHEKPFELKKTNNQGTRLNTEELVRQVQQKFLAQILEVFGEEFLKTYHNRILFAVAVDEIECWLLPLFYEDKIAGATNNCLHQLNKKLARDNTAPINSERKDYKQYSNLSRGYLRNKTLMGCQVKNPSLNIFIGELTKAFPLSIIHQENIA